MESAQHWAFIMASAAKAIDNATGSQEWETFAKHGMESNHNLLGHAIQMIIEDGYEKGTLLGKGIRETRDALKHLVPMANFTKAPKSELAKEYLAYVKAKGLSSSGIDPKSGTKVFSRTPACFLHNPGGGKASVGDSRQLRHD